MVDHHFLYSKMYTPFSDIPKYHIITFLVAVCCSIHPIIIHSILSIMLSLALYHRFQLSILSESSFAAPRLRVQHMAGSEEAFSMFVDGRVYWIHHLHCSLWTSYSYVIVHLHCLHPCV